MSASGRRGRNASVLRTASLCAALGLARTARAADVPPSFCPLTRAPALSWLRLAQGDDCAHDEDGNGLDDEIETTLASCFVPEVKFDSKESALRVDEPQVLFSAYALGAHTIRLHYAFLFARDGGYVLGTEFPCMTDDHDGDVESVAVDVTWTDRDRGWYGAPLSMRTLHPRDGSAQITSVPWMTLDGTHPVLYATAGKHHWLYRAETLTYACGCGPIGRCGKVVDRADGAGPSIAAPIVQHAPGFYDDRSRIASQAPLDDEGGRFWNACAFGSRGARQRATRSLVSNDLGELGYPGERLFGACFRGGFGGRCGETISVAEALAWDKPFATGFGARKLLSALLGSPIDAEPTRTTVWLPFGAAPQSIWRY
jgi:hypothetical protein